MLTRFQVFFLLFFIPLALSASGRGTSNNAIVLDCPKFPLVPGEAIHVLWSFIYPFKNSQEPIPNFTLKTSPSNNNLTSATILVGNNQANITITDSRNFKEGTVILGASVPQYEGGSKIKPMNCSVEYTERRTVPKGAIAGIVIGAFLTVLAITLLLLSLRRRLRNRSREKFIPSPYVFAQHSYSPQSLPSLPRPTPFATSSNAPELPSYPESTVQPTSLFHDEKQYTQYPSAPTHGWYQGMTPTRMQQIDEEQRKMRDFIESMREKREREWDINEESLRGAPPR